MRAPAKIAELNIPCLAADDQDVLRFYVPMNHVALLTKEKCRNNLLNDLARDALVEAADLAEDLV